MKTDTITILRGLTVACVLTCVLHPQAPSPEPAALQDLWMFLDRDGDGLVGRYEGADAFMQLTDEADGDDDGSLTILEVGAYLSEMRTGHSSDARDMFDEMDLNLDGTLTLAEVPEGEQDSFEQIDADGDSIVSLKEWDAAWEDGDSESEFEQELMEFLADVDADGDDAFTLDDLPEEERSSFVEDFESMDLNRDGRVTREELLQLAESEEAGAEFEVDGTSAHMNGVIGPSTPGRVLELVLEHPDVRTIVMHSVPGSMDDEANLRAARIIRRHGFKTHLPADGDIASGGTDLFLAGVERTAEPGSRIGVHSWSGGDETGADVPRDDPQHELYLSFYREIDTDAAFYWYTLEAAPAWDIHWMTSDEIAEHAVLTGPVPDGMGTRAEAENESLQEGRVFELDVDTSSSSNGVVPVPDTAPAAIRTLFDRYTRLVAPNGKPIHFFAQDRVTDEMLVRARAIMKFYLTDAPGTLHGADKTGVANAMGDRAATLVYFNTERDAHRAFRNGLGDLDIFGQDLYAEESVVEGSSAYMDNSVRDATLEEVFHLVHGAGIRPALPAYHARIEEATQRAIAETLWFTNEEWEREGSSPFEYIISVIDVMYGLWAHDPDGNGESFHGEYRYCTPSAAREHDPLGTDVLMEFLPPSLSFQASVSDVFEGAFSLSFDASAPYTLKSQHLQNASLQGERNSSILGNAAENTLVGNAGANELHGLGGDDTLNGGPGADIAVFQGVRSDYTIATEAGWVLVVDNTAERDGTDRLREIEYLKFSDLTLSLTNEVR